ncbi:hypothetical protein MCA1172 [Methylococcus capsulatus str. Bath]|uniref:Uncharacterized protein n=1 Tax=Methylococcus capsulatus (strain ATCC 33009 / NCIMB 11132 / Bath) TaxID=243233 RepID=Q609Q9_METCA|nr:hypothetical protein MCA1172 [Methylococcus capsulatus str. Bath]
MLPQGNGSHRITASRTENKPFSNEAATSRLHSVRKKLAGSSRSSEFALYPSEIKGSGSC